MLTDGGASSGYCSIGATDIATRPARTNRIEMTDDRIGRSMKKCVNMRRLLLASVVCFRGRRVDRGRGTRCDDLHRLPRHDLQHTIHHDAIALGKTILDHDVL